MLLYLNNELITPGSSIAEEHRDYLLPGMCLHSWNVRGSYILLQEIWLGQVQMQYLVAGLSEGAIPELLLKESEHRFILSLEGAWTYCIVSGKEQILKEGHYSLIMHKPARISPSASTELINRLLCLTLLEADLDAFLHPDAVTSEKKLAQQTTGGQYLSWQSVRATAAMLMLALQLTQTSYLPEPRQFHVALAEQLLREMSRLLGSNNSDAGIFSLKEADALYAAKQFILSNLQKNFSLDELTRHCGINREQLRTGFRSMYAMSPYAFLRKERMELASQLLQHTNKNIKQIARSCGYRQLSNFSTAFRRHTGMSPALFRKKSGNQDKSA